jgi:hypothetical protein
MYFQTWTYAQSVRECCGDRVYRFLQKICGRITGHEWSKTEWGYGMDGVDVWCRWCGKFDTISMKEAVLIFPEIRKICYQVTGELPPLEKNKC